MAKEKMTIDQLGNIVRKGFVEVKKEIKGVKQDIRRIDGQFLLVKKGFDHTDKKIEELHRVVVENSNTDRKRISHLEVEVKHLREAISL